MKKRLVLPLKATDLIMLQVVCRAGMFWYVLDESESEYRVQVYNIEHYLQIMI